MIVNFRHLRNLIFKLEQRSAMTKFTYSCLILYLANLSLDSKYHSEFFRDPLFNILQKTFAREGDSFNTRNYLLLFNNLINNPKFELRLIRAKTLMEKVMKIINSFEFCFGDIRKYALLFFSKLAKFLVKFKVSDPRMLLQNFLKMVFQDESSFLVNVRGFKIL